MKKVLAFLLSLCLSFGANAQFIPGQVLTAQELNNQFALYLPIAGGTVTGNLTVNGTFTAPSGSVNLSNLAQQAANTVVANATAASASPTAVAVPSCNTSTSGLQWTSGGGFACNSNLANLSGGTFIGPVTFSSSLTANGTVSGTGLSTYLASPPAIGGTTPAAGSFTTITASSTITPNGTFGIVGATGGGNAQAGSVGEYVTTSINGVAAFGTGVAGNVTSMSLTAGDWDVWGVVLTVGGTAINAVGGGISTTSATFGALGTYGQSIGNGGATLTPSVTVPVVRINVSSTTTVFLVGNCTYTGSPTFSGTISARRVR